VLWQLVEIETLTPEQLVDEVEVSRFATDLSERLQTAAAGAANYTVVVRKDSERNIFYPVVRVLAHGIESETEYHHEFFSSGEYRSLVELGSTINQLIEEDGYFQRGEKTFQTRRFADGLDWLMTEARRGYNIQRYKGLGEMNPDQLWETTMDPDVRRMLQVTVEDAIAADQIFTTLMGDAVEPRRDFIEENALSVANLDV
jgi:DNA gyrase subunit B